MNGVSGMSAINVMTSQETNKIQNNVVYLFGNTTKTKVNQEKREFKVKRPILDKEYLNTPVYNKPRESTNAIPKEYLPMIKEYFRRPCRYSANNLRNFAYFCLEINIGRRAGDALNLKVKDVLNEDGTIKDHIIFAHEQKTGKRAMPYLNTNVKEALAEYLNTKEKYNMSDYLFQNYKTGEKLSVDAMRKVIKRMAKDLKIDMNLATHSLRRTFATEAINRNPNNEMLVSMALNHSDIATTRRYTKRTQQQMDRFYEENAL